MPAGAIIGAVASIGGSLLSSHSNSKAISSAADAQAQASAQAAAVQKQIYQQNVAIQTPLYNTGIAAGNQINAFLGLPQMTSGLAQGAQGATGSTTQTTGGLRPEFYDMFAGAKGPFGRAIYNASHQQIPETTTNPGTQTAPVDPAIAANAAYDRFKNYTGYTSRLTDANTALNGSYAARGTLQSGAAMQAMAKMNQDYASNEFGNYMGYLGGQQQLASGAANALSGVGTNYANAASNIAINQGNNAANAAIARANNTTGLINGIGSAIGGLSSYIK